jgi:hypothetical protein
MEQYIQCGDIAENPLYVKASIFTQRKNSAIIYSTIRICSVRILSVRRSLTFLELSFICRN